MRKLFIALTLLFILKPGHAQTLKKVLFGNFVFEQQVIQYQYKRDGNIHSLKLSSLSQPNPATYLNDEKLNRTEAFLSDATKVDSSNKFKNSSEYLKNATDSILLLIAEAPKFISELKKIKNDKIIWKEHNQNVDKLLDIFDKYKIEKLEIADTLAKDIYEVSELLIMYKKFLQNVAEPQTSQEVHFAELKEPEFKLIFKNELQELYLKNNPSFQKLSKKIDSKALEIMYEIKARADFKDDEPVTAYMNLKRKFIDIDFGVPAKILRRDTNVSRKKILGIFGIWGIFGKDTTFTDKKDTTIKIKVNFEVKNIIIEFEDGGIKNVFADLQPQIEEYIQKYGSSAIRFRNNKPISITGKFDSDVFNKHKIYSGNTLELMNNLYEEAKKNEPKYLFSKQAFLENRSFDAYFLLSNLLDYKVVSETDNEDYSPTNSKIELNEPHSLVELKKEKRSNILSAKAYTDFMGLSDDQPNGLVQIEVSKKVNIVPGRHQGLFLGILNGNKKGIYTGGLAFIEPKFTVSKVEENNRHLKLDYNQLDKDKSLSDSTNHFLVNPLEVVRYQQWNFGMDVNLLKLNLQNRKSNFQINGNFGYGRTLASDSIKIYENKITQIQSQNISRINTTSWGLGLMYEVKPDSRYGLSFGYDFKWIDLANKEFQYNKIFSNLYHSAWFNGFFKVNDDSKLFWRFRKNWMAQNNSYNYYQIQLGYELDIFKAAK